MKKYLFITVVLMSSLSFCCKNERIFDDDNELCILFTEMLTDDQKIRKMELFKTGTKKQKDSLWKIQSKIDEKNTKLLIEITKKRGWVNKKELGCNGKMAPVVIFRHSPKKYFEEIRELIVKESKAGRMNSGDYKFIDNHLRGRPDFDFQIVE